MKNSSNSYDFLWLSIALFPLLMIAMLLPIQPHDYWWYLRLGRDVLETSAVPVVDTYSSIQAGQPIVYQAWLAAVCLWLVYDVGGIPMTALLLTLLVGLTYAMLWVMMRQDGVGPRLASLLVLLAGLSGSNNWGVRPQMFAYSLFLGFLWILLRWHRQENRSLWLLSAIGLAWTNLHGSFILLFILAGLAVVFGKGDRKKLLVAALIALCITLINPRGFALWRSVIGTFTDPGIRDLSPEWLPPLNQGWQMNIFFAWLLLLTPLAAFARRSLSAFQWVLFISFSWLAVSGTRYVIWDLFVIPILTSALIPESIVLWFDRPQETRIPAINFGLGAILLLMPLMLMPGLRAQWWHEAPPAIDPQTPVGAAAWLAEHPELPGAMWNDVVFGSYLIHALPARPVWIDTRIQVIFTSGQAHDYLFVQSAEPGWDDFLVQEGVNLLVLARTQPALVEAVQTSDQWCEQYHDAVALIFSRCQPIP